jgi:hypothetical protein
VLGPVAEGLSAAAVDDVPPITDSTAEIETLPAPRILTMSPAALVHTSDSIALIDTVVAVVSSRKTLSSVPVDPMTVSIAEIEALPPSPRSDTRSVVPEVPTTLSLRVVTPAVVENVVILLLLRVRSCAPRKFVRRVGLREPDPDRRRNEASKRVQWRKRISAVQTR